MSENEKQANGFKLMFIKAFAIIFGVPLIVLLFVLFEYIAELPSLISFLFSGMF